MSERITFWYGCNVLRHGDIIHSCVDILRRLGFDVQPAGGPDYCCGSPKDANQTAADGMAHRTITRFNALQRDRVVTWCPSCHTHMTDFIGRAYRPQFGLDYFVDLIHSRRDQLVPHLKHAVPVRVLLHRHKGFNDKVEVNAKAAAVLALIPGVEVIADDFAAASYMCSQLAGVPAAMADMVRETVRRLGSHRAHALVTIFHQCYRELCGLESEGVTQVFNYVQLLARSMGLDYPDEYKEWKKAGANAGALIGEARIAAVGEQLFERAILPELVKRPAGLEPK